MNNENQNNGHQLVTLAMQKKAESLQLSTINDKSEKRAFQIIYEQTSAATLRAHTGDLNYWEAWLKASGFNIGDEITEKEVRSFIIQHIEGLDPEVDQKLIEQGFKKPGLHKLATIKRRLATLSMLFEKAKRPNPCKARDIKDLLSSLTKQNGKGKSRKAITKDILDDMLNTCEDNLKGIRDRALLLFAWSSGGRRRSEVAAAEVKDLTKNSDNDYVYIIPKSKTDQKGEGSPVPIKGRAAQALSEWLKIANITDGKIFRSINKWGQIQDSLTPYAVHKLVRNRISAANVGKTKDEKYKLEDFGAHSLRSGFVTEAGIRNKNLGDVMAMTTHRNVGTVMKYYQAGSIMNNSAANLAD